MKLLKSACYLLAVFASTIGFAEEAEQMPKLGFEFALYFAPEPSASPEKALEALLADKYKSLKEIAKVENTWVPIEDYAPPTADSFRYLTAGLDVALAPKLAEAEKVFLVYFEAGFTNLMKVNQQANSLLADLAEGTEGYLWDEECRLLYSREVWTKLRVETWQRGIPDMSRQMHMHAYRNPKMIRVITLGMSKFGLPDLVMEDVFGGNSMQAGNTLNIIAQSLIEGQMPVDGILTLKLKSLKHDAARSKALENPLEGAKGQVKVSFKEAPQDQGDPDNLIMRIDFPDMEAATATERQSLAFTELFGAEDKITGVQSGDQAIQAASERAKKEFIKLREHFQAGLEPNERIIVKHGFTIGDEKEYMWIELIDWRGDTLHGILLNNSHYDESLKEGKRVSLPQTDIFDYAHYKPDGTTGGNETTKLIQQLYQ